MQDAEALERITRELVEDEGRRRRALRRDPLGPAASTWRAGSPWPTGSRPCARARARRRDRTGTVGAPHLAPRCARTTPERERRAGRDRGPVPRRGPDRLGPGRARGRLPRSARPRARVRGGSRATACGSRSTPGSGAARPRSVARSSSSPSASPTARAPSTTRRSAPSCVPAASPSTCARPRTGRPASCRRSRRTRSARLHRRGRAGDPQHRRHDRLRHQAVRGVRQRRRGRSG